MTDTLTRAANDASEALGMDVRLYYSSPGITTVHIGAEHKALTGVQDFGAALAYLEGLETGARIMRERYRLLVDATTECIYDLERHAAKQGPGPDRRLATLREALAELEA